MPIKVTDPAVLAALNGGSAPSAPAGPVLGPPPRPKEQAPYKPPAGYRGGPDSLEPIPGGPADPGAPQNQPKPPTAKEATEGSRKAAGFLQRALGANTDFEATGVGPRSYLGDVVADNAPRLKNYADDPKRQQATRAEKDFISAVLRLESGAAIAPAEYESQGQIYFPQPGDSPEVLRDKALARRRAIESLKLMAGPLGDGIEIPAFAEAATEAPAGGEEEGLAGSVTYEGPNPANNAAPQGGGDSFLGSVGDLVEGAAMLPGMAINPVGQAVYEATGYGDQTYDFGKIVREGLGLPRNPEGLLRNVNTFGASALTGGMAARGGATLANPGSVTGNVLNTLGRSPIRDTAAGAGAGAGAYGGEQLGGPVGALAGGLAGGIGGYAGASALAARNAPRQVNALAASVRDAGQAEGVTVNRAMVDPRSANRVSGVDATMAGGPRVQEGMRRIEGQIEDRVTGLGRGGQAMDDIATGDKVKNAGERFIKDSGKIAKRKYDRAEQIAGDAKVTPKESLSRVDGMIAKLSETPETFGEEIKHLQKLRNDLSKDLSVGGLRRMRTALRKKISKGDLVYGEDEANVLAIMDGAADDIRAGLAAQGKEGAANAFDAADKAYRARMEYINGTVQKLIGKRNADIPAEQIAKKFTSMTANDARGLQKFYATLEPDEAADVAATFAERIGKNNKGDFSIAHFLSQTEKMSDQAIRTVFGREGAESIKNLRTLGKEVNRVTGAMNSRTSKTAVANDYRSWLANLMFGGGGGAALQVMSGGGATLGAAVGGAAAMGAKAARDVLTARSLMSPKITKWMTQAPRTASPGAINAHYGKLAAIAKNEPALASEIKALQEAMMKAANDNTMARAAASSEDPSRSEDNR